MAYPNISLRSGRRLPLSAVLNAIAEDSSRESISVGDLLDALRDRAVAALMFIFAVLNVLPAPPGASTLLGAPLLFLAAQLAFGRKPWLPAVITRRALSRSDYRSIVERMVMLLRRAERLLRPRWVWLAVPPMEFLVGLVCLVLATVVVLPIPLGNMLPAFAICLMALGILERDGLWVLAGLVIATGALALVSGVMVAMLKAALHLLS